MGIKRSRNTTAALEDGSLVERQSKRKKGFSVGPANLPDGTYRRKVQRIKADLIQKAKVKKAYVKIKAEGIPAGPLRRTNIEEESVESEIGGKYRGGQDKPATLEPHPQRQALVAAESPEGATKYENIQNIGDHKHHKKWQKRSAFSKELEIAEKRRQEAEANKEAREFRHKYREAMARARRPDQHGKRRLGRESKVLLSRVQRAVGSA